MKQTVELTMVIERPVYAEFNLWLSSDSHIRIILLVIGSNHTGDGLQLNL